MFCYNCGAELGPNDFCTRCGADVSQYKRIVSTANLAYNQGLEKARVRDLAGAVSSLRQCLKLDKTNIDARNLLGLVYFELGECGLALKEWITSQNIRPTKNIANDYISLLNKNRGELDKYSQAVKKYNQALGYCHQGESLDYAEIALKSAINSNPKYVQALQLLALVCIKLEKWDDARKYLTRCQKIDVSNTITLRYISEIRNILDMDEDSLIQTKGLGFKSRRNDADSIDVKKESADLYSGGVVRRETKTSTIVINVAIGILIGIAVSYMLILPARISAAREGVDESLKAAAEQLDAKTAQISALEQDVKKAQNQTQKLQTELDSYTGEDGKLSAIDSLLSAVNSYLTNPEDMQTVAGYLDRIDEDMILNGSESFAAVYKELMALVGENVSSGYYDSGMKAYQEELFEEAIADLTKAYSYDNSNGDALYNLGNAYRKSGDTVNALETYEKVISEFPDTEMATRSQQHINELNVD